MTTINAQQVAEYFLSLSEPEEGDLISHLKLQKLLYYAQGHYLAMYGRPLFKEKIYAWNHGPVVKEVFQIYKSYGSNSINKPETIDLSVFDEETRNFLNQVYEQYGQFSAWKLRNMTHEERPWKDTPPDSEISHSLMKEFFTEYTEGDG